MIRYAQERKDLDAVAYLDHHYSGFNLWMLWEKYSIRILEEPRH